MRRHHVGTFLILALALPGGGIAGAHAASLQAACKAAGYSHNKVVCAVVPAKGTFTIKVPGKSTKVKGKGTSKTAGTQITVIRVPPPVSSRGGFGLRLRATGKFSALTISSGKLFKYNASS